MELLKEKAVEGSTYIIQCSFVDEAGEAMTPNSVKYTLTNAALNTQNDLESVSITPAETVNIVLSGPDLSLSEGDSGLRYVFIDAEYNSTYGSNLPLKKTIAFYIDDYKIT